MVSDLNSLFVERPATTYRSLICLAIVKKACSTLVAFFADVSRKGMVSWSANSCKQTVSNLSKQRGTLTHLRDTVLHNLLARQVGLVAHKQLVDTLRRVTVNLLQPLLDVRESVC